VPGDRMHAPDERLSLRCFAAGIATSAAFLAELADRRESRPGRHRH
jgi:acetylornithine deacetylase/succinyl-diaminopimelate desuccinylase-like protein